MAVYWIVEPELDPSRPSFYLSKTNTHGFVEAKNIECGVREDSPTGPGHTVRCSREKGHSNAHAHFSSQYSNTGLQIIAVWQDAPGLPVVGLTYPTKEDREALTLLDKSLRKKIYLCDCGSRATHGTPDFQIGHSDWCAASSSRMIDVKF